MAVASYHPTPPPQISRRLSDQQDSAPSRRYDDQSSDLSQFSAYRFTSRDKAASAHPGEDSERSRHGVSTLRRSPPTARSRNSQEPNSDDPSYTRRRPSIHESNSGHAARASYRQQGLTGPGKSYNSSPLTRSFDLRGNHGPEAQHGIEGTDSTASNAAPSTVWDELDDLKSRINRLELTGKMPPTSGAAISRLSDERPPTAATTATTMSSSPKKSAAAVRRSESVVTGTQLTDTTNATFSPRDTHPILQSALANSKPFLNVEVYRALESAAQDALALSAMMGTPGHPGPVSSGASTLGSGTTITDRQLRRKTDSVCRSLTELCIALGEGVTHPSPPQPTPSHLARQEDAEGSSGASKLFNGASSQRRLSVAPAEATLSQPTSAPKVMSKFEERRNHILTGSSLPSSRVGTTGTPSTPHEGTRRRSSLLMPRNRRAVTEEPEARPSSSHLRTRRAGTEEPDDGRRTSFLTHRRPSVADGDEDVTFRAPSRATTEDHTTRGLARGYETETQAIVPEPSAAPQPPSALPRRRFVSTNTTPSRLAMPSSSTAGVPPVKYQDSSRARRGPLREVGG